MAQEGRDPTGVKPAFEAQMAEQAESVGAEVVPLPGADQHALPLATVKQPDGTVATAESAKPAKRRRGPNRRTSQVRDWLENLGYSSPLHGLAETWSRPLGEIMAELKCKPLEAFQLQQAARIAALPYWEQKQPMAVAVQGNVAAPFIIVHDLNELEELRPMLEGEGVVIDLGETEENQDVSEGEASELDGQEVGQP